MRMQNDLFFRHQHDADIDALIVARPGARHLGQVHAGIVGGRAEITERRAAPDATTDAMRVARGNVAHLAMLGDHRGQCRAILELQLVHLGAGIKGRVVHEQIDGRARRFRQPGGKPGLALGAEMAGDVAGLGGVEKDKAAHGRVANGLYEAIGICLGLRRLCEVGRAVVVVSEQGDHRRADARDHAAQAAIGFGLGMVGEIAEQHAEGGICMVRGQVVERPLQALSAIHALRGRIRRDQMDVRDDVDLHVAISPTSVTMLRMVRDRTIFFLLIFGDQCKRGDCCCPQGSMNRADVH